jgi:hypothetical protein
VSHEPRVGHRIIETFVTTEKQWVRCSCHTLAILDRVPGEPARKLGDFMCNGTEIALRYTQPTVVK